MAEYFALASGKGGTGKSTLSVALAVSMARRGKRVLIADMDIGLRSLDLLLQLENSVTFDLGDIAEGRCEPSQALFPVQGQSGLWLVCAPLDTSRKWDLAALLNALEQTAATFDCVFIDVPAGLGFAQLILRQLSATCLLVATPDSVSVRDIAKMRDISVSLGREALLIINRVSRSAVLASGCTDFDAIADDVAAPIVAVFPEDSAACSISTAMGLPNARGLFPRVAHAAVGRLLGESIPLLLRRL